MAAASVLIFNQTENVGKKSTCVGVIIGVAVVTDCMVHQKTCLTMIATTCMATIHTAP